MADPKGSKDKAGRSQQSAAPPEDERGEKSALFPELLRRAVTLGLSGIFTTETAFRRALGDTVPQDWVDFAVDQSDRTRVEFTNRVAEEMALVIERMDVEEVLRRLLEDHRIEIQAEVRLVPQESKKSGKTPTRSKAKARVVGVDGKQE